MAAASIATTLLKLNDRPDIFPNSNLHNQSLLCSRKMDRSFFRRLSNSSTPRDSSDFLAQHNSSDSHPLQDLPPHPYSDTPSAARSSTDSPSPSQNFRDPYSPSRFGSSPSRSKKTQVQFAAPPPPIVSSVIWHKPAAPSNSLSPSFSNSKPPSASSSRAFPSHVPPNPNPLAALQRRERVIQNELQILLDAQSFGLVQGPGLTESELDGSDDGSRTPTSRSDLRNGTERTRSRSRDDKSQARANGGVVPVRQPKKKRISLRGARRGILSAILDLMNLKMHESSITAQAITELQIYTNQVDQWTQKLSKFNNSIAKIGEGSESREIAELQTEKSAVENEIRDLEDLLAALRARDRRLGARIEENKNRKEAKVSSYREARRGVEREVDQFLKRPPLEDLVGLLPEELSVQVQDDENGDGGALFLSLPPKRRTLEMASGFLKASIGILQKQQGTIDMEQEVLREGAKMWEEGVQQVVGFEEELRKEMQMQKSVVSLRGPEDKGTIQLKTQIHKMDAVIEDLETKVKKAEKEGWNLLICALGAETEAFRQGKEILQGLLKGSEPKQENESPNIELDELGSVSIVADGDGSKDKAEKKEEDGVREPGKERDAEYRSESEDDGPHPDLLVSQDDDDV